MAFFFSFPSAFALGYLVAWFAQENSYAADLGGLAAFIGVPGLTFVFAYGAQRSTTALWRGFIALCLAIVFVLPITGLGR